MWDVTSDAETTIDLGAIDIAPTSEAFGDGTLSRGRPPSERYG